jgi:D-sedoheptulose 7-phosphate isomerase
VKDRASFIVERRDRLIAALTRTDGGALDDVLDLLERAWLEDRFVLLAGNGGSAATAEHMNLDLSKTIARIAGPGRGFRTIALTHGSALSSWANDLGPEAVFSGQVRDLGRAGDILVVLSAMGNSDNVIEAVRAARDVGLHTIAFLGAGGGLTRELVDVAVVVESDDYGIIEDTHLALGHFVTDYFVEWACEPRARGA